MPVPTKRTLPGVAVFAVAVAAVLVWDVVTRPDGSTQRTLLAWAVTGAGCGSLYWLRRRPVPVAVFTLLCTAVYFPVAYRDLPLLLLAFVAALFMVVAEGHLVAACALVLVATLGIAVVELMVGPDERHVDDTSIFLLTGWFVGVIAVGHAHRTRQAYLHEVQQRALSAEREKDVRARQSATEERLRIARELHDVLGHNISLINVQSAAALHRQAKGGAKGGAKEGATDMAPAMEAIRDASRDALRELRATLGVLRQVDEAAPTAPADVGLAQLGELAERACAAGVEVRTVMDIPEEAPPLPPQVGLAAYRIVQESLTNVVRHAEATTAVVTVRYEHEGQGEGEGMDVRGRARGGRVRGRVRVRVRVEDDGEGVSTGAPDAPLGGSGLGGSGLGGSGLGGMAERARALGGELTAGNVPDDAGGVRGFAVAARLPADGGTRTGLGAGDGTVDRTAGGTAEGDR